MEQASLRQLQKLGLFLLAFYTVWTAWAASLVQFPPLNDPWLRAGVRLLVWIVPTLVFVRVVEGPPVFARLGFQTQARRGIICGILASLVLAPLLHFIRHGFDLSHFKLPTDAGDWANPILTAPLAEEILFRGLVFRILKERIGLIQGLLISSVLFALSHLPYWWFSGEKSGMNLWLSLLEIAGIGALLCGLFRWTGSLWTPLIYHVCNNLVSMSFKH